MSRGRRSGQESETHQPAGEHTAQEHDPGRMVDNAVGDLAENAGVDDRKGRSDLT